MDFTSAGQFSLRPFGYQTYFKINSYNENQLVSQFGDNQFENSTNNFHPIEIKLLKTNFFFKLLKNQVGFMKEPKSNFKGSSQIMLV